MKQDEFIKEWKDYFKPDYNPFTSKPLMLVMYEFFNHLLSKKPSVSDEEIEKKAKGWADEFYDKESARSSVIYENIEWENRFNNFLEGAKWALSLPPQVVQSEVSEKETVVKDLKKCKHNYGTHYSPETGTRCQGCKQKLVMIQVTETEAKKFKNG